MPTPKVDIKFMPTPKEIHRHQATITVREWTSGGELD
jgi:hypothetical protein